MSTLQYSDRAALDRADDKLADHEATYSRFVHLVYVGLVHAATFLVALAIGGVEGNWGAAFALMFLASAIAVWSFVTGSKWPMAVVMIVALSALALRV
jgi:hypothetical protein